jgi:hypothetical protein
MGASIKELAKFAKELNLFKICEMFLTIIAFVI